jgi:predicted acylesterase/phospholipase RssA
VVKAFLDANLLPRVVSGTSAGGLVAAFVCCYTEDELKALLVPELADRITACEDPFRCGSRGFGRQVRLIQRSGNPCSRSHLGARFDALTWAKKVFGSILSGLAHSDWDGQCTFFTRGSLTFREAYLRTGRILNISVIPADRHS